MTCAQAVKDIRAMLDQQNPNWRSALRRQMDTEQPGWVAAQVRVMAENGEIVEVALLANPERVPDPSEIDPETDPFR
jgi:hypothetical protein